MQFILDFFNNIPGNPFLTMWYIFRYGGWIFLIIILWPHIKDIWLNWRQAKKAATKNYILLSIDVPRGNEQTPKAVENIFSTIAGAHGSATWWQKWWEGDYQVPFSFEIVSVNGYTQFIIYTTTTFRDLVESSIYSQYPDAEITEVPDYTDNVPHQFPDPEYEMFGLEYDLHKPEVYPLRTYLEFEHSLSGEFLDPMASLLEAMTNLKNGEQVWVQFVLTPITDKWKKGAEPIIQKLIGAKPKRKDSVLDTIVDVPLKLISAFGSAIFGAGEPPAKKSIMEDPPTLMIHMTPGEKKVLEAIERKISKIGFETKIRILYIGKKELFSKARGIAPIVGAFKQLNTVDLNRFQYLSKVATKANYAFAARRGNARKVKFMRAYRNRSTWDGWGIGDVLNIEELATLWHFPVISVKAPLVKKSEAKRAEPPVALPVESEQPAEPARAVAPARAKVPEPKAEVPVDLPFED